MKTNPLIKFDYSLLFIMAIFTWAMMIYAARPWGNNYAYQTLFGYIGLFLFMLWGILPYAFLFFLSKHSNKISYGIKSLTAGILIISTLSAWILIDTNFIHIDAQGGLIFIFLPCYQIFVITILWIVILITADWKKREPT